MGALFIENCYQSIAMYGHLVAYRVFLMDMVASTWAYYFAPRMLIYDQDQGMLVYADELTSLGVV